MGALDGEGLTLTPRAQARTAQGLLLRTVLGCALLSRVNLVCSFPGDSGSSSLAMEA